MVVAQDEVHLIWGDLCGYTWIKRGVKTSIPMTNFRERETYYGALNLFSGEFFLCPQPAGNGLCTVNFLTSLKEYYKDKRILMLWDGASYHSSAPVKEYLKTLNQGIEEKNWKLTFMKFASNAPEQNPVEDVWLQGKNFLRKNFIGLDTFSKVKKVFFNFLNGAKFHFHKFEWYTG